VWGSETVNLVIYPECPGGNKIYKSHVIGDNVDGVRRTYTAVREDERQKLRSDRNAEGMPTKNQRVGLRRCTIRTAMIKTRPILKRKSGYFVAEGVTGG
jgi:hypothetical protein